MEDGIEEIFAEETEGVTEKVEQEAVQQRRPHPMRQRLQSLPTTSKPQTSQRKRLHTLFDDCVDAPEQADSRRAAAGRLSVSAELDLTIRDRIRSKYATALNNAQKAERFSRRLSVLRQKSMIEMRALDTDDHEENIEEALERSWRRREKLMEKLPATKSSLMAVPSAEEQWNFFTKHYELKKFAHHEPGAPDEESDTKIDSVGGSEAVIIPIDRDENEKSEQVESDDWATALMTRAYTIPYSEQIALEKNLYFVPSFLPVPTSRKAARESQIRADEGLHSYQPTNLARRNLNTLEQRLLIQSNEDRTWFDNEGKLISAVPVLANFLSRVEIGDNKADVIYCKAIASTRGVTHDIGTYQLDIDVSKLVFTHHRLFSKEHVLAIRLMEQYKHYLERARESLSSYYSQKLDVTRSTLVKLQQQLLDSNENIDQVNSQVDLLAKEAKTLRQNINKEEILDRQLFKNILHTWNSIKQLRNKQGCTTSAVQLLLKKQPVNVEEDRALWEERLIEELKDQELEYEEWCKRQMEFYRTSRQAEADSGQEVESPHLALFDRNAVWNRLVENALKTRRNPGEPIFVPILGACEVTPIDKCPSPEKDRRHELARCRINLRIFFNDLEVCTTPTRPLNSDFCVQFGQVYKLHVYEWPQSVRIKVFESATAGIAIGGGWTQIGDIYVPTPSVSQITTSGVTAFEEIEFSNDLSEYASHAGVGTGFPVDFEVENQPSIIPRTSGILQCSALWGRAKDGTPLIPPVKREDESQSGLISLTNAAAVEELQEMLKTSKFDPNNPENARWYSVIKDVEAFRKGDSKRLECFRLEPNECQLVSEEDFVRNHRFRLLQLRNEHVLEFRNLKMVPAIPKEIPADVFQPYDQRTVREKEKVELSDIDAYRQAINKYVAAMRNHVIQRLAAAQSLKSLHDVVIEEPLPTLGSLSLLFEDAGRPLKPVRKERKRIAAPSLAGIQVKLMVNVVRAFNVPCRDTKDSNGLRTTDANQQKVETTGVDAFVELTFQGQTVRTSTLQGVSPTWNQQLFLNFESPNEDFSPSNLQSMNEMIYINLYDRVVTPLPHDDREDTTIHQQVEKRWLGCLNIPISTVYCNGKVSGAFRLKVPPFMLGYAPQQSTPPYLQVFIAIDPPLAPPEPIRGKFESIENETFLTYTERWLRDVRRFQPFRRFVPLVIDTNGRSVFVGRYLRPIRPPAEVEAFGADKRAAADIACRVVSLIPFVADTVLFSGLCDIWATCDQFLEMCCGDEEEHAILLWCWLSSLEITCHLLLGDGIPEGPRAAYVLAQFGAENVLYNASSGIGYAIEDVLCPLRSVGCIVNRENIYANLQQADHPSSINFDFTRTVEWRPFFTRGFPNPGLRSVQPEYLQYFETDANEVIELQEKLERAIREQMMRWRPHQITRWNRFAAQAFRQLLPVLESTRAPEILEHRHSQALQSVYESYKVVGFPLNSGYTSIEKIVESVHATNIFSNSHPDVEFALTVYVHPYTNVVLSVWVYIASLLKRR